MHVICCTDEVPDEAPSSPKDVHLKEGDEELEPDVASTPVTEGLATVMEGAEDKEDEEEQTKKLQVNFSYRKFYNLK